MQLNRTAVPPTTGASKRLHHGSENEGSDLEIKGLRIDVPEEIDLDEVTLRKMTLRWPCGI